MLLDTIASHDTKKLIKLVCIESLAKPLPQIHSVPAMVLQSKQILFGKQVFDYLLLPGKGKLVTSTSPSSAQAQDTNNTSAKTSDGSGVISDPMAFSITSHGLSDNYAPIEDDDSNAAGNLDRMYNWATISDIDNAVDPVAVATPVDVNKEVRVKKELPDLSKLMEERALELTQNDLSERSLPIAVTTRG